MQVIPLKGVEDLSHITEAAASGARIRSKLITLEQSPL